MKPAAHRSAVSSRRAFLQRAGLFTSGLLAAPLIVPGRVLGADGAVPPSERIVLGAIGIGNRGSYVLDCFVHEPGVQFVAICDVKENRRKAVKKMADDLNGNQDCAMYRDLRELLARADIDAVLIATGPNWHAAASILAAEAGKDVYWEAEAGDVMPPMSCGEDSAASGGFFVWMPAKPGERASSRVGSATWEMRVEKAGKYYLWGRILAPTPENDSFYLHVFDDDGELIEPTTWPTGTRKQWQWIRVTLERTKSPMPITLPAGPVSLQLRVREAGTKIDRMFITSEAAAEPH